MVENDQDINDQNLFKKTHYNGFLYKIIKKKYLSHRPLNRGLSISLSPCV